VFASRGTEQRDIQQRQPRSANSGRRSTTLLFPVDESNYAFGTLLGVERQL
jgi:hypothetical protein